MNDWADKQAAHIMTETPEEKAAREIREHAEATKGLWALEDRLRAELGVEDADEYDEM